MGGKTQDKEREMERWREYVARSQSTSLSPALTPTRTRDDNY